MTVEYWDEDEKEASTVACRGVAAGRQVDNRFMYVAEVDQSGFGSSAKLRTGGLPLPLTRGAQVERESQSENHLHSGS